MNRTKIEWVKNPDGNPGYSWNPLTGCLNHIDGMCKGGGFPCYAYKLANTRLRERYLANKSVSAGGIDNWAKAWADPFYPRFWPERLLELPSDVIPGKERGVFVCDMSDLFGIGIPEEWTNKVLGRIKGRPEHRFYLLTKQPQNLAKWSPFPENCYVGVSATNAQMFIDAGNALKAIDAKVKYISAEPLLSWNLVGSGFIATMLQKWGIKLVILGSQTKPTVMPKIEWVQEIVEACDKAGIPVFLKDSLRPLFWNEKERVLCPDWARMEGEYDGLGGFILRQEMPV